MQQYLKCGWLGAQTDSSEKGRIMCARVKGKTENDLANVAFAAQYNFRHGVRVPFPQQKNLKPVFKFLAKIIKAVAPKSVLTLEEVGKANMGRNQRLP